MCIATCPSDLIVILCGGPHSAVTHLMVNPLCDSSFLEVHLARGVTFWVPTHAPQARVTHPGGVSTFSRTMHVVLPWSWPSHGSYLSQGLPAVAGVLHESGYPLLVLELMALMPSFSFLRYYSELSRPEAPLRCLSLVFCLGDAFLRRRLVKAMPSIGDALTRRCLRRSIC